MHLSTRTVCITAIFVCLLNILLVGCAAEIGAETNSLRLNTTGLTNSIEITLSGEAIVDSTFDITANSRVVLDNFFPDGTGYTLTLGEPADGEYCYLDNTAGVLTENLIVEMTCGSEAQLFDIGGQVTGLADDETITLTAGGRIASVDGGSFTIEDVLPDAAEYTVTVLYTGLGKRCTVTNGAGTIASANVSNVLVSCETTQLLFNTYREYRGGFGGRSGGDTLCSGYANTVGGATTCDSVRAFISVSADDQIADFPTLYNARSDLQVYAYDLDEAPTYYQIGDNWADILDETWDTQRWMFGWSWTGSNNDGTVADDTCNGFTSNSNDDHSSMMVNSTIGAGELPCSITYDLVCACLNDGYQLGGTLSDASADVVLTVTDGDDAESTLTLNTNGTFYFNREFDSGDTYTVVVSTTPEDQTCTVTNGSGTIDNESLEALTVACEDIPANETVFLFPSDNTVAADFAGRNTPDSMCQSTHTASLSDLSCAEGIRAFISIDADDSISDMPTAFDIDSSLPVVYTEDGESTTAIGDNWADLLDGEIDNSIPVDWWSGSDTEGAFNDGFACTEWTSVDGMDSATAGMSSATDFTWIADSSFMCDDELQVMCVCF